MYLFDHKGKCTRECYIILNILGFLILQWKKQQVTEYEYDKMSN